MNYNICFHRSIRVSLLPMNKSKQVFSGNDNTSLLTFFKSKQICTSENSVSKSKIISRDNFKEDYALNTLVWGNLDDGWCPAIIVQDSISKKYNKQGSLDYFEWHLRFLTETTYTAWQYGYNIHLFQLDKSPIGVDMDQLGERAKSALLKANYLFNLPPNERLDFLEGVTTNLSQCEVVTQ